MTCATLLRASFAERWDRWLEELSFGRGEGGANDQATR